MYHLGPRPRCRRRREADPTSKPSLPRQVIRRKVEAASNPEDRTIHCRFVGASDGSTTLHSLLRFLLLELKEVVKHVGKLSFETLLTKT